MMKVPNQYRVPHPIFEIMGEGNDGCFVFERDGFKFFVVSSDGGGWEHVSVSILNRRKTPTWEQMCMIKDLFWTEDETVVQYHPAKADYVNFHSNCLHLWAPKQERLPKPPAKMVGPK